MSDNDTILSRSRKLWPEFTITKALLEHPTSEFVMEFYNRCAISMTSSVIRSMAQEQSLQPKEEYAPTVLVRLISSYLSRLELGDGYEVTLADLYTPTAKRTQIRFKILLHLLIYVSEREDTIREKVLEVENLKQQVYLKQQEKAVAKEDLGKMAEKVSLVANQTEKLRNQFKQSQEIFEYAQEKEKDVQLLLNNLRQDLKTLVTTFEHKQTLLNNLKSSVESLKTELVPQGDYQSLSDLLTSLKNKSTALDANIEALNGSIESKVTELKRFHSINEELIELVKLATELESSQNSVITREKQLTQLECAFKNVTVKLNDVNEYIIKLQENVHNSQEQLKFATAQSNNFKEHMELQIQELDKKLNEEVLFQNKVISTKEEITSNIKQLKNDFKQHQNKCQQLQVKYANDYRIMVENINSVTSNFHGTLEKIKKQFSNKTN